MRQQHQDGSQYVLLELQTPENSGGKQIYICQSPNSHVHKHVITRKPLDRNTTAQRLSAPHQDLIKANQAKRKSLESIVTPSRMATYIKESSAVKLKIKMKCVIKKTSLSP